VGDDGNDDIGNSGVGTGDDVDDDIGADGQGTGDDGDYTTSAKVDRVLATMATTTSARMS
jgi:hypothetical protein